MKTLKLTLACILTLAFSLPTQAETLKEKCDSGKQAAAATHLACMSRVETKFPEGHAMRAQKIHRCDSRLEARFRIRERHAPEIPGLDSSDSGQCSHYGDVENIKAYNAHVAKDLQDGTASSYGASLMSGNGERSDLDFYAGIPVEADECGGEVRLEEAGVACWTDAACEGVFGDCCDGYYEKCKKKADGTPLYECNPDVDECGSPGLDLTHGGPVIPMPYGWTWFGDVKQPIGINPGGNTLTQVTCRDGSSSGYAVSLGSGEDAHRVLIRIEGGGACFNKHTCNLSPPYYNWFWFADAVLQLPYIPHLLPIRPGVFNRKNSENPFRHWTHVYIPHCTGDVGIGQNEGVYIEGLERPFPAKPHLKTNTFQGWNNFEVIAKDMILRFNRSRLLNFGIHLDVERYILAGDSAGGYGAMGNYIHFKELVQQHSSLGADGKLAVVDVLDDSGAPLATGPEGLSNCLQERMWTDYKGSLGIQGPVASGGWGLANTIGSTDPDTNTKPYCPDCTNSGKAFIGKMANHAIAEITKAGRYAGFMDSQYDATLSGFFGFGTTACTNTGLGHDGVTMRGKPCLDPAGQPDNTLCNSRDSSSDGTCTACWQLDDPDLQSGKHAPLTPNQFQTALGDGLTQMWQQPGPDNFKYFILAGDKHATIAQFMSKRAFYTRQSNGIRAVDWAGDMVGDGMTPNSNWSNVWPNPVTPPAARPTPAP